MSCQSIITPDDCKTFPSQITAAPEPAPAPVTETPGVQVDPTMPPIGLSHDPLGWLPDFSSWTWDGVADAGLLAAACVVCVLVMTVAILVPASMLGWRPTRLRNWLFASVLVMPGASALWAWDVYEPVRDFSAAAVEFMAGEYVTGAFGMAALLIPAAWLAATLLHARRRVQLATVGLASPARTERAL
ncbi:hypothetical protein, partial [Nocardia farcinica]